jgi:hypothetical protein
MAQIGDRVWVPGVVINVTSAGPQSGTGYQVALVGNPGQVVTITNADFDRAMAAHDRFLATQDQVPEGEDKPRGVHPVDPVKPEDSPDRPPTANRPAGEAPVHDIRHSEGPHVEPTDTNLAEQRNASAERQREAFARNPGPTPADEVPARSTESPDPGATTGASHQALQSREEPATKSRGQSPLNKARQPGERKEPTSRKED